MKKYVYRSSTLRCRIRYVAYMDNFELQIQTKWLFLIWVNAPMFMTVKEGFWGESDRHPVLSITCLSGNIAEAWKTGTLNVLERAISFLDEYQTKKRKEAEMVARQREQLS